MAPLSKTRPTPPAPKRRREDRVGRFCQGLRLSQRKPWRQRFVRPPLDSDRRGLLVGHPQGTAHQNPIRADRRKRRRNDPNLQVPFQRAAMSLPASTRNAPLDSGRRPSPNCSRGAAHLRSFRRSNPMFLTRLQPTLSRRSPNVPPDKRTSEARPLHPEVSPPADTATRGCCCEIQWGRAAFDIMYI